LLSPSVPLVQAQLPFWQVWPLVQTLPHVPQLLLSPSVPFAHWQFPLWHVWPLLQTVPQVPQLLLSVWVLTQAPLHSV
jgi:hypothetical protein